MNEFAPGSVAPVSTNSPPVGLDEKTLRSSTTPTPAAPTSVMTSNAINHLRIERVAGDAGYVARCDGSAGGGNTGAAPVAASWVSWLWKPTVTVAASRAARANSTVLAYRSSGFFAIPLA